MSNYYYLGRSAFPNILIWLTLSLFISGAGFITLMAGLAAKAKVNAQSERHKDDMDSLAHEMNGGMLDLAVQATETYMKSISGLGAYVNLETQLIKDARLERRHAKTIASMVASKKSIDDIKTWLSEQIWYGLNKNLADEKALIELYEGLLNGSTKKDELMLTLQQDRQVPGEVIKLASYPNFILNDGARSRLNVLKGENSNLLVQLEDLLRQEEESIQATNDRYEKRTKLMPEFKAKFFEASVSFDKDRQDLTNTQNEAWAKYIQETKTFVEKRRKGELEVYDKEEILNYKNSLITKKVDGQDWIPPLDLIDGKILTVDNHLGTVTIDIGRLNALRSGQNFDIYKVKGEALQHKKGRLTVVETLPNIAVCKVIQAEVLDPIAIGDVVTNGPEDYPFDRKLSPQYFLSGRFLEIYSKDMVVHMIKSSGGIIRDKINKNINYVVIGDQVDEDDVKLCLQLGVRTLRVRDLPRQLDYSFDEVEELKKKNWN